VISKIKWAKSLKGNGAKWEKACAYQVVAVQIGQVFEAGGVSKRELLLTDVEVIIRWRLACYF